MKLRLARLFGGGDGAGAKSLEQAPLHGLHGARLEAQLDPSVAPVAASQLARVEGEPERELRSTCGG